MIGVVALGLVFGLAAGCKDRDVGTRMQEAPSASASASATPVFVGKPCKKSDQKQCEDSCAANDAVSCLRAAEIHGMMVKDAVKASELATRACDLGSASGCAYAGRLVRDRKDLPAEEREKSGFALLERACEGGVIAACTDAAVATTDAARIRRVLEKGCASGPPRSALSCAVLGSRLVDGELGPKDVAKGTELFEKACAASASYCLFLAERLVEGRGVAKDVAKAVTLFDRGCRGGDARACASLGVAHREGVLTAKDGAKARSTLETGCDKHIDWGPACYELARTIEQGIGGDKDPKRAFELYLKACKAAASAGRACLRASEMSASGAGVAKDPKSAEELVLAGCERAAPGDAREVCDRAVALLEKKAKAKIATVLEQRCARDDGHACVKWRTLGGAPSEVILRERGDIAKRRCEELSDGDGCRTWADLGGTPTAEQLKLPVVRRSLAKTQSAPGDAPPAESDSDAGE